MITRLYIHNYRCFDNFTFAPNEGNAHLVIGRNGVGKSTLLSALSVFQSIGRGENRIKELFSQKDVAFDKKKIPVRFEIDVALKGHRFSYQLAFELPEDFKLHRVLEEKFTDNGVTVFERKGAQVSFFRTPKTESKFSVDWHLMALPLIQENSKNDSLYIFKEWLSRMILLAPIPKFIEGETSDKILFPDTDGGNLAAWFSYVLGEYPEAYTYMSDYLTGVLTDFKSFRNEQTGSESKRLLVKFANKNGEFLMPFDALSDGEKCYFVCALVLAANRTYGPLFCFWDEPDNYLSLPEVGYLIGALKKTFQDCGQIIITSHSAEVILKFSEENAYILNRYSHLEPTISPPMTLAKLRENRTIVGDLHQSLLTGEVFDE